MVQGFSMLMVLLSSILGATLLWGVQTHVHQEPPRIATLNVRALIDAEITRVAKSKLSNGEAAEQVRAYGKQLARQAEQLAQERHWVLLPELAVISGAVDVTPILKEQLQMEPHRE